MWIYESKLPILNNDFRPGKHKPCQNVYSSSFRQVRRGIILNCTRAKYQGNIMEGKNNKRFVRCNLFGVPHPAILLESLVLAVTSTRTAEGRQR